jgi:hypothetical protein
MVSRPLVSVPTSTLALLICYLRPTLSIRHTTGALTLFVLFARCPATDKAVAIPGDKETLLLLRGALLQRKLWVSQMTKSP